MILNHIKHILYLVNSTTVIVGPRTPLMTIYRTKVSILVR